MTRNLLTLIVLLAYMVPAQSQVHTSESGDVGIGTTSPAKKFHVVGDTRLQRSSSGGLNYLDFVFTSTYTTILSDDPGTNQKSLVIGVAPTSASGTNRHIYFQAGKSSGTMQTRMVVRGDGNIGIGTTTPKYRLQVAGNSKWTGSGSSYTEVNFNSNGQYLRQYALDGVTQSWLIRGYSGTDGVQAIFNQGGIHVNGTVKTKEVNVTATGWPDYVFKPEYKLKPLSEVANYIHENGHLPNIPTEAEVMENGVNLAEMNVKLLEKVEELTLYVMELQRKNEEQDELLKKLIDQNQDDE